MPKLRFPEFVNSGEWEEKNLGDVGKVSMCKRIMKDETTETGEIPFYKIGTFGKKADAYIDKELYEDYRKKYSFPKKGDILISASGTIGRLVVYDGLPAYFQDSNIVWIDNNEELVKNSFLSFFYETVKWTTSDTTIARLYNDNLRSVHILRPSIKEQQKIADCLSSVDSLISAQSKKVELLKEHKKGLMQQLFPQDGEEVPKLRFPEFKNAPKWEEKPLGEIVEILNNRRMPISSDLREKGLYPYYGASGIVDYI
ncbi:MAG: restriction endonuclease subunit S, partial [Sulfurimonas sp.]|nr:restriction endonuclease subunit S [Sulfurimonas sp.]